MDSHTTPGISSNSTGIMEYESLSDTIKVRVHKGLLEFLVVPKDERVQSTTVTLTRYAWIALTDARDTIKSYLSTKKAIKQQYYRSKYFEVKEYDNQWNVDLLTHTKRGNIQWPYSISLTENEWMALCDIWTKLDEHMATKHEPMPAGKIAVYEWRWVAHDDENDVRLCSPFPHYTERHAITAGHSHKDELPDGGAESILIVRTIWHDCPTKAEMFYHLMRRLVACNMRLLVHKHCQACQASEDHTSPRHKEEGGCADPDNENILLVFYRQAVLDIKEFDLYALFDYCWKALGQPVVPRADVRDLFLFFKDYPHLAHDVKDTDLKTDTLNSSLGCLYADAYLKVFDQAVPKY